MILYPKWYDRPYQYKAPSLLFTPRDTWFFTLPDNDPAKKIWQAGIKHRWDTTPDFLKNDPKNMSKDFKFLNSQQYYLGN